MFTRSASNGAVRAQWKIDKIVPKGDMSGDGRIDVSPDGKRLLLSIDMGEESGRKNWDGPLPHSGRSICKRKRRQGSRRKNVISLRRRLARQRQHSFSQPRRRRKRDSIYGMSTDGKNLKRLIKNARFPSVSAPDA